jgi:hypothetical protein
MNENKNRPDERNPANRQGTPANQRGGQQQGNPGGMKPDREAERRQQGDHPGSEQGRNRPDRDQAR